MAEFAGWQSLAGGMLIGVAASLLLILSGRVAGISGMIGNLLLGVRRDLGWQVWFLIGLIGSGLLFAAFVPNGIRPSPRSLSLLVLAGFLVGIGTRLGSGCTSGHGVCGVSRLSPRSLLATATFLATGVSTATIMRWLGGGT